MNAAVEHIKGDYERELMYNQAFVYEYEALIDCMVQMGVAFMNIGKYNEAVNWFDKVANTIEIIFRGEEHR